MGSTYIYTFNVSRCRLIWRTTKSFFFWCTCTNNNNKNNNNVLIIQYLWIFINAVAWVNEWLQKFSPEAFSPKRAPPTHVTVTRNHGMIDGYITDIDFLLLCFWGGKRRERGSDKRQILDIAKFLLTVTAPMFNVHNKTTMKKNGLSLPQTHYPTAEWLFKLLSLLSFNENDLRFAD